MRIAAVLALLSLASACATKGPQPAPPTVPDVLNLAPADARDIASIDVGDPMEAALLQQELKVAPIRMEGSRLYYASNNALNAQLRSYGYDPKKEEPLLVHNRLVQIARSGSASEDAIRAAGARIVTREDTYWLVYGSLAALQNLARSGFRITPLKGEARPREVKIEAATLADVQKIGALRVDIFTVRPHRKTPNDEHAQGFDVYGAAFDDAIDELRAAGYNIERISTVPERRPQ